MSKIGALRDLLFNLLQQHERDGTIPTNARFLYYKLVHREELSKQRTGARPCGPTLELARHALHAIQR
jgi:hypothetical protein